ncbi:RCC1 domain-containing protein [Mariniflexile sp.]|uniref:RCC1 domain-containing protein n=1 Tax=Mariniflexile sp. TaxID=1979402 RepID=UPI0040486004
MKRIFTLLSIIAITTHMNAQCWQSVATGSYHSLAIKADGTLWTWGLGTGVSVPKQIGTATNWQTVAAGYGDSFALKTDGTLWAWGDNDYGQLGLGVNGGFYFNPVQVGTDNNWQSIATGAYFVLALKNNGSLWSWGIDDYGQLGDGGSNTNRSTPMQIGTDTDWRNVYAGYDHAHAIKTNGTLWGWGQNFYGNLGNGNFGAVSGTNPAVNIPTQIGTDTNWLNLSIRNSNHVLGLKTNGTLWAWGQNFGGALGDGSNISKYVPTQIGTDTNWQSIYTGNYDSHALKTDGTLWAWGRNDFGQLGDGTLIDKYTPIQIGTDLTWQRLTSGGIDYSMGIKLDGSMWGWGKNPYGQLGNGGSNSNINSPITINCPTSTLGVGNFTTVDFMVFPNPVKDILTIKNPSNLPISSFSIMDIFGKTVLKQAESSNQINVESLKQGMYFLQTTLEGKNSITKFIKR